MSLNHRRKLATCRSCQYISLDSSTKDKNVCLTPSDDMDMTQILDSVMPNASKETRALLLSQKMAHDSDMKDKRTRQWSQEIIQMCLALLIRSPGAYHDMADMGFLTLPSGRLLIMYKNAVPQETGKWCNFIYEA